LLRRILDTQGRSRGYINGRPATLAQLKEAGERLVDLHGQHAHQSLGRPETQRELVDAFGGFATLARETANAWRRWREAIEHRAQGERDVAVWRQEREALAARHRELEALAAATEEWTELLQAQSRLSHAANLIEVTRAAQDELADGDAAIALRIAAVQHRLRQAASHDRALDEVVTLTEEAGIRIEEAARALRAYGDRFDLDPAELGRIEQRIGAILDVARKYRVRPEALAELAQTTSARLAALDERRDADGLARAE